MRIKNLINLLLFLLGVGILGLMIFLQSPSKLWEVSKESDWLLTSFGLVLFAGHLFVRSLRWHVMVKVIKDDVKLKEFMPVYFLNFMVSNITPARSGEAAAPFLMKRHVGSATGMGFSVVIVDRILDTLSTVAIGVLGFIYCVVFLNLPRNLIIAFYSAMAVLMAMTGAMIAIVLWRKGASVFLRRFTNIMFRKRQKQLLDGLDSFYEGFRILRARRVMPKLLAYVILSWALLAISYFLRVRAVLDASALSILSCWIISLCIGMASFIPSGLGSSQVSFAYLLSLTGVGMTSATAASLLTKFMALGVIFLMGLASLFLLRKSCHRHSSAARVEPETDGITAK